MQVEFWLRTPGEHKRIIIVGMEYPPRAGETVAITADGTAREVHSVAYIVTAEKTVAKVLLKD